MKNKKSKHWLRRYLSGICAMLLLGMSLVSCSDGPSESELSNDTSPSDDPASSTISTSVSESSDTDILENSQSSTESTADTNGDDPMTSTTKTQKTTASETTVSTQPSVENTDPTNTVAEIRMVRDMPRLYVDGKRTEPVYFMPPHYEFSSNEALDAQMKYAAQYGVDLLIYPYGWENHDMRRFFNSKLKGVIQTMLQYNPDAHLILRLGVTNSLDSMGLDSSEAAYLNGKKTNSPSMASDVWYEKAKEILKNVVENVMSDEYLSQYVIGFEILGGETGEWFEYSYWDGMMDTSECNRKSFARYLKNKYKTDAALQSAWGDPSVTFSNVQLPDSSSLPGIGKDGNQGNREFLMMDKQSQHCVDYLDYLGNQRAERLGGFADTIKAACNNTKLAIVYYGYHFDVPTASSAHMCVSKLLTYDSVDMLSGPVSYQDRADGGMGAYMGFIDSITAAGKMWMDEGDYRSSAGTVSPTLAHAPTLELNDEVMRREVAKCMVFNTGVWWLDLFGHGWFNYESFWQKNQTMNILMNNYYNVQTKKTPEICLILDESALSLVSIAHAYGANGLQSARSNLYRSGYDFGTYLVEDVINGKVNDAKVYIFLNPWRLSSEEVDAIEKNIHQKGKVSLFMYGNGMTSQADFKKLTGMTVESAPGGSLDMNMQNGISSSVASSSLGANPCYYVSGDGVTTLGTYKNNGATGKAGMASYSKNGWTSIFYGGTCLTDAMITYLADLAGAHQYVSTNDVVYANDQMVVLHTTNGGKKTVNFPKECTIYNLETNTWTTGDSVTVNTYRGQTVILFYGDEKMIHKIVG